MAKGRPTPKHSLIDKNDIPTIIGMAYGLLDDSAWNDEGLTVKEVQFVHFYCGEAAGNADKAAKLAGYEHKGGQAGYRVLTKPNVSRAVSAQLAKRLASKDGDALKSQLARLAASDMTNFISVDEAGKPQIDFAKAQQAAAIGQIRDFKVDKFGAISLRLHDPRPALETLAKMMGLLRENVDVTSGGKPIEPPTQVVFDNERFAELYRLRTGGSRLSTGDDPANGN